MPAVMKGFFTDYQQSSRVIHLCPHDCVTMQVNGSVVIGDSTAVKQKIVSGDELK